MEAKSLEICFGLYLVSALVYVVYAASRSQRAGQLEVSWLHVRTLNPTVRATRGELLMPRHTLYSRYPDRFDSERYDDYIEAGFVVARHGSIFFTGRLDGELRCMILKEPSARKFAYLEGLRLATSVDDRTPFAVRAMCHRLGLRVSRDTWKSRIGLFTPDDPRRNFENADVVERALGASGPLLYKDPELRYRAEGSLPATSKLWAPAPVFRVTGADRQRDRKAGLRRMEECGHELKRAPRTARLVSKRTARRG